MSRRGQRKPTDHDDVTIPHNHHNGNEKNYNISLNTQNLFSLKNNRRKNHSANNEENKGYPSQVPIIYSAEGQKRRNGNLIAPLHRSLLYLVFACLFQSVAFLRKVTFHDNPFRPTQAAVSRRPILYLHVGPKKTASTTIQTKVLGNQTIRDALKWDNITVSTSFNYVRVQRLRDHCLAKPENCRLKTLRNFLLEMVDSEDSIKSCETYSNLPRNNFTFRVFRTLGERSHVKIILVYRRSSSWLPSMYYQERKGNMYYSAGRRYETYETASRNPLGALNLPQYFDGIVVNGFYGDSLSTYDYFVSIYGQRNVIVVELDAPDGVAVDFLCRGIKATHACALLQSTAVGIVNDNSRFLFDHDLLVLEAFRRGFLTSPTSNPDEESIVDRHEATIVLQRLMQQHNMTTRDLPQICLDRRQEEILWNRTMLMEQRLARKPRSDEVLRVLFEQDRLKFCSIDTAAVMENATLRNLFFGDRCVYFQGQKSQGRKGCETRA